MNPEVLKALAGGGLGASDYAGLTPEQIQMVAGQGQQDRQLMLGAIKQQSDAEMEERKQSHTEMHDDRVFKVMQNQETRAGYQMMMDAGFKAATHQLDQKRLGLEQQRLSSALLTDSTQRKLIDAQILEVNNKARLVKDLETIQVELPFKNTDGTPANMSLGSLMAGGGSFAEKAFTYNLIKQSGGEWGGGEGEDGLGISGLGGGGKTTDAAKVRAIQAKYLEAKGVPKFFAQHAATQGIKMVTAYDIEVLKTGKDTAYSLIKDPVKRMEKAQEIADTYNAAIIAQLRGDAADTLKQLSMEYDEQNKPQPQPEGNGTGTGTDTDVDDKNNLDPDENKTNLDADIVTLDVLDTVFKTPEGLALQKEYPEWFHYSAAYGGYRLKPNVTQLAVKEIGDRAYQMSKEAGIDASKIQDYVAQQLKRILADAKTAAEPVKRSDVIRGHFNR